MPTTTLKRASNIPALPAKTDKDSKIAQLFDALQPISLEDTNKSAKMLTRYDNKYVLTSAQLQMFLDELKSLYRVLQIGGLRTFRYNSCYFDDHFKCYYDHHQGKRLRFKARTRKYVDTGDVFFEVKLKDHRGRTIKERITSEKFFYESLDPQYLSMLCEFYHRTYHRDFGLDLKPSMIISNDRVTLVSSQSAERMTIDFGVGFAAINGPTVRTGDDFIIVETKSGTGKGLADQLMRQLGIRKSTKCSKYCIGANLVGDITKKNNFRPILGRVQKNIVTTPPGGKVNLSPPTKFQSSFVEYCS